MLSTYLANVIVSERLHRIVIRLINGEIATAINSDDIITQFQARWSENVTSCVFVAKLLFQVSAPGVHLHCCCYEYIVIQASRDLKLKMFTENETKLSMLIKYACQSLQHTCAIFASISPVST